MPIDQRPLPHATDLPPLQAACECGLRQRRRLLGAGLGLTALGLASGAQAQVDVGKSSSLRNLVPAETLESAATTQYQELLAQAKAQNALAPDNYPQLQRLRRIAQRLIPYAIAWNPRAQQWRWEVNLIGSKQINAFCMPGGKIAFYTGIIDQLKLSDDEIAMVMGHEMAHALREHSREQLAKTQATNIGIRLGASLLGLGDLSTAAANLWKKMGEATGGSGVSFLSTHPAGPDRIRELEQALPKVQALYESARKP